MAKDHGPCLTTIKAWMINFWQVPSLGGRHREMQSCCMRRRREETRRNEKEEEKRGKRGGHEKEEPEEVEENGENLKEENAQVQVRAA